MGLFNRVISTSTGSHISTRGVVCSRPSSSPLRKPSAIRVPGSRSASSRRSNARGKMHLMYDRVADRPVRSAMEVDRGLHEGRAPADVSPPSPRHLASGEDVEEIGALSGGQSEGHSPGGYKRAVAPT